MMVRSNFCSGVVALLSLVSAAGCVSGGGSTLSNVVDATEGMKGANSPIVEAYIQYLVPDSRWAGPVLWTIHVSARDTQTPVFEVIPALPKLKSTGAPELSGRVPASGLGMTQGKSVPSATNQSPVLSQEEVRDRFQHLGAALASSDDETSACISAVKVRLTRADGTVQEKQACRGSAVWTQVASELASEFMTQSRYPASGLTAPAPAAETIAPAPAAKTIAPAPAAETIAPAPAAETIAPAPAADHKS
jgi:hypothetical protein